MKESIQNGVLVLTPHGYLIGGEETQALDDRLRALAEAGVKHLVINLGETRHLNSTAHGVLISTNTNFIRRGGQISLARIDPRIEHIFVIAKLDLAFDVYPTVERATEALRSLTVAKGPANTVCITRMVSDRIATVTPTGRLHDLEDGDLNALNVELAHLLHSVPSLRHIVMNCGSIVSISSGAVGPLISTRRRLSEQRGRFILVHVKPDLEYVLRVSKLDTMIEIAGTEAEAFRRLARAG